MYNLGWGDPVVIRQALLCHVNPINIKDNAFSYSCIGHPEEKQLIQSTKTLSKFLFGKKYNHVILTSGATQAINALLSYYKDVKKITNIETHDYYFPLYPMICKQLGLKHNGNSPAKKTIKLIDSPNNPTGTILNNKDDKEAIWDAVYANDSYCRYRFNIYSDSVIGSFGKLFGLPGYRLGWICTNNDVMAEYLRNFLFINTCNVPMVSIQQINYVLKRYIEEQWSDDFHNLARTYIDNNKTEIEKRLLSPGGVLISQNPEKVFLNAGIYES